MRNDTAERIYAGVLGKLIGVFYGRPIEGWPYEKIRDTFGVVDHYVSKEVGTPLIVADDDVAGTFTFLNVVEDCTDKPVHALESRDFGETWLDYIIENKTIFWWGGLGRSTEHTAFLRLKQGIPAPMSGSIETNGSAVAEQIGAQIFMDALALMCPGDPDLARHLVKQSASVSHDGIAVEAACFLATLESMAFEIRDLDELLDAAAASGFGERLLKIVRDVREECAREQDFRVVRDWLETYYGYQLYPGNCHVIPNFALIIASLILGGDDFYRAMEICISCGWDTDCNGANLGCINGIRLGLDAINETFDLRGPIADRLYNISAEGGNCVTDAVQQTRRILAAHAKAYGEKPPKPMPRYAFEYRGSVQGFTGCPYLEEEEYLLENGNMHGLENGLLIRTRGGRSAVSSPVMFDPRNRQENYCLTASPTLYESQTLHAELSAISGSATVQLYAAYHDFDNQIQIVYGQEQEVSGKAFVDWKIPDIGGMPVSRVGVLCTAKEQDAAVLLTSMDWDGAPEHFEISGSLRNYDIGVNMALESFVTSAKQFHFDSRASFTVSHPECGGVATTGTQQWSDYRIVSQIEPGLHRRCGLVGRTRGHRRYYALVLWGHRYAGIICRVGSEERCLAQIDFPYEENRQYRLELCMCGNRITGRIEDEALEVTDDTFAQGGAGFLVDEGTALAYGLLVEKVLMKQTRMK